MHDMNIILITIIITITNVPCAEEQRVDLNKETIEKIELDAKSAKDGNKELYLKSVELSKTLKEEHIKTLLYMLYISEVQRTYWKNKWVEDVKAIENRIQPIKDKIADLSFSKTRAEQANQKLIEDLKALAKENEDLKMEIKEIKSDKENKEQ